MKKFIFGALLIVSSLLFSVKTPVLAETNEVTTQTEVLTFLENQNQQNVGNISGFAVTENSIFYVNENLNKFDTLNKLNYILSYQNVTKIKQTEHYVGFICDGALKLLKNSNEISITGLNIECDFFNLYEQDGYLYISYVNNSMLHFIKVNSNLEIEIQRESDKFVNQQLVATCLNDAYTYLIVKNGTNYGLLKVDNLTFTATALSFNYLNCTGIELFTKNNETYFLLTASLNQSLVVLKESEDHVETITSKLTYGTQEVSFSLGELSKVSDAKFFDNKIYVADATNQNIQAFTFENNELIPSHVVLTASSFEDGYFKDVNDFCVINNSNLLISDTGHNRLQQVSENGITVTNTYITTNLQNPKFYLTSNNQTFWYYFNGKLIKQTGENALEFNVGEYVSDLKIDAYNNIYYLDYNLDKLVTIKNNTNTLDEVAGELNLTSTSKLELLNEAVVICTNNTFKTYTTNGVNQSSLTLTDTVVDFTGDFYGNLYALTNHGITKVLNSQGVLSLSTTLNYTTTNLTLIRLNKVTGDFIAYNNTNCNFIKISNSNFVSSLTNYSHLSNPTELDPQITIFKSGKVLADTYISSYPYNTGLYKLLSANTKVFVLGEIENSYYVMFNNENTVGYGYINKNYLEVTQYQINNPSKVTVINKNIKLYKFPTILRDKGVSFSYTTVQLNSELNVVNFNLSSIDNSEYFAVITNDNKILYVNSSDVTLSSTTDITSLPDLNAQVLSTGGDKVKLFLNADSSSQVVMELNNNQKVYIENYDSTQEYTYITVITEDKQEVYGYVQTKNLKLISNNPNLTSAYILLGVAVLIGFTSIIVYIKYKNSND